MISKEEFYKQLLVKVQDSEELVPFNDYVKKKLTGEEVANLLAEGGYPQLGPISENTKEKLKEKLLEGISIDIQENRPFYCGDDLQGDDYIKGLFLAAQVRAETKVAPKLVGNIWPEEPERGVHFIGNREEVDLEYRRSEMKEKLKPKVILIGANPLGMASAAWLLERHKSTSLEPPIKWEGKDYRPEPWKGEIKLTNEEKLKIMKTQSEKTAASIADAKEVAHNIIEASAKAKEDANPDKVSEQVTYSKEEIEQIRQDVLVIEASKAKKSAQEAITYLLRISKAIEIYERNEKTFDNIEKHKQIMVHAVESCGTCIECIVEILSGHVDSESIDDRLIRMSGLKEIYAAANAVMNDINKDLTAGQKTHIFRFPKFTKDWNANNPFLFKNRLKNLK